LHGTGQEDVIHHVAQEAQPHQRAPFSAAQVGQQLPDARRDQQCGEQSIGEIAPGRQLQGEKARVSSGARNTRPQAAPASAP
jgi:hypothetical protein